MNVEVEAESESIVMLCLELGYVRIKMLQGSISPISKEISCFVSFSFTQSCFVKFLCWFYFLTGYNYKLKSAGLITEFFIFSRGFNFCQNVFVLPTNREIT